MRTHLKNALMISCIGIAAVGVLPMTPAFADYSDTTSTRLRRLEDIEKIKNLKHRYVTLIDEVIADPGAAQEYVDLFATPFEVEYDEYGTFKTKAALKAFLQNVISPGFSWGFHSATNPRIYVNGDFASAEWYLVAHAVYEGSNEVTPFFGRYIDQYVRTCDGWKVKKSVLVFDPPPVEQ